MNPSPQNSPISPDSNPVNPFRDEYHNVMATRDSKSANQIVDALSEILGKVCDALDEDEFDEIQKKDMESLLHDLEAEIENICPEIKNQK